MDNTNVSAKAGQDHAPDSGAFAPSWIVVALGVQYEQKLRS